jgi:glycosyltransferase involved in cell wall biosynthesis
MSDVKLKIGLYSPNYPGLTGEGGIGTYTRLQAHEFTAMGHEVHVLTPGDRPDTKEKLVHIHFFNDSYIPVVDRFIPGFGKIWRTTRSAKELCGKYALDIFEFPNWDGVGLSFGKKPPVPFVVRLCTSAQESQIIDEIPLSRSLEMDIKREYQQSHLANCLVTHSKAHCENMSKELNIKKENIKIIPIGIEVAPDYIPDFSIKNEPLIVFVGRMEKRKGSVDLLRAFPLVLEKNPTARLIMIGADRPHCPGGRSHRQFLAEEFSDEVQQRISLKGRLSDSEVTEWMQRATVFVAPSLYESFGIIFLEAMRWGTPVIGTHAGGIPEIVIDGESGLLTEPANPQALAEAILRVLSDDLLRSQLSSAGKKRVETHFPIEKMASEMIQLYRKTIEESLYSKRNNKS